MKKSLFIILALFAAQTQAADTGYRQCAGWDTFCKNPAQIVATKCRLGVPVKHSQCKQLGIPSHYMVRGGGSLVTGLPYTENNGTNTKTVLDKYTKI